MLKKCRLCGYISHENKCPECNCNVMISRENYTWHKTPLTINWSKLKYNN